LPPTAATPDFPWKDKTAAYGLPFFYRLLSDSTQIIPSNMAGNFAYFKQKNASSCSASQKVFADKK